MNRTLVLAALMAGLTTACSALNGQAGTPEWAARGAQGQVRVVPVQEVHWQALNPARGAASPRAATLWGDRLGTQATGFLARFAQGFSSPPHIHNVTYRAVVIDGYIHNDDPAAQPHWMGAGSFWTQPRGEAHITAASAAHNLALVEIDHGPYRVQPPTQAYDNGERAINVDAANVVWLPVAEEAGVARAYLWGRFEDGHVNGSFVRLPAGFQGHIEARGAVFHAVVIKGTVRHHAASVSRLLPGSYFGSDDVARHVITAASDQPSVLYIRSNGEYQVKHGQIPE